VIFTEDKTVVPKESAWFASEIVLDDQVAPNNLQRVLTERRLLVPMHSQPLYQEDWIGLRELDERGGVVFSECEGQHMQINDCWEALVREFAG
jgi:palmitoyl-protein thioesterase